MAISESMLKVLRGTKFKIAITGVSDTFSMFFDTMSGKNLLEHGYKPEDILSLIAHGENISWNLYHEAPEGEKETKIVNIFPKGAKRVIVACSRWDGATNTSRWLLFKDNHGGLSKNDIKNFNLDSAPILADIDSRLN